MTDAHDGLILELERRTLEAERHADECVRAYETVIEATRELLVHHLRSFRRDAVFGVWVLAVAVAFAVGAIPESIAAGFFIGVGACEVVFPLYGWFRSRRVAALLVDAPGAPSSGLADPA